MDVEEFCTINKKGFAANKRRKGHKYRKEIKDINRMIKNKKILRMKRKISKRTEYMKKTEDKPISTIKTNDSTTDENISSLSSTPKNINFKIKISSLPQFSKLDPLLLKEILAEISENLKDNKNNEIILSLKEQLSKNFEIKNELKNNINYINKEKDNINEYNIINSNIKEEIRTIVIDWLMDMYKAYNLSNECLFLSVKIFDTFFINKINTMNINKLYLLGICSLSLSDKYFETTHFTYEEILKNIEVKFSKEEIFKFEKEILQCLDYILIQDSCVELFNLLCLYFDFDLGEYYLGNFFLQISLLNLFSYSFSKQIIALSAVYLTMKIFKNNHSNYSECFFFFNNSEHLIKDCSKYLRSLAQNVKESKYRSCYENLKKRLKSINFLFLVDDLDLYL